MKNNRQFVKKKIQVVRRPAAAGPTLYVSVTTVSSRSKLGDEGKRYFMTRGGSQQETLHPPPTKFGIQRLSRGPRWRCSSEPSDTKMSVRAGLTVRRQAEDPVRTSEIGGKEVEGSGGQ